MICRMTSSVSLTWQDRWRFPFLQKNCLHWDTVPTRWFLQKPLGQLERAATSQAMTVIWKMNSWRLRSTTMVRWMFWTSRPERPTKVLDILKIPWMRATNTSTSARREILQLWQRAQRQKSSWWKIPILRQAWKWPMCWPFRFPQTIS